MKIATILMVFLATIASTQALYVKDPYPKGADYVFVCELESPTYDWSYGDGEKLFDVKNKDTFHTFRESGRYSVTCSGENGETEFISVNAEVPLTAEDATQEQLVTAESSAEIAFQNAGEGNTRETPEQRLLRKNNGGYLLTVGDAPYLDTPTPWEMNLKAQYEYYQQATEVSVTEYATPSKYVLYGTALPVERTVSETDAHFDIH
jgi:hypothetical protein